MQELNHNRRTLLESADKGTGTAKNPLALLFRLILRDLRMQPYRWNQLMDRFLSNPRNGIADNPRDRSSARGNLNKELFKDKLTFGTIMRGLALLDPTKVRFEIHCTWKNAKTTIHGVDVLTRRRTDELEGIDAMPDDVDDLLQTGSLAPSAQVVSVAEPVTAPAQSLNFKELPVLPAGLQVPQFQSKPVDSNDPPPWQPNAEVHAQQVADLQKIITQATPPKP